MDKNTLHLNAKIPDIKDKFEIVQTIYKKEKNLLRASQTEVFRWLILKEIENQKN